MPSSHSSVPGRRTVSLVTLGCARNEVDSEELAGRLEAAGWTLTDRDEAAVVLVNTCGFIEAAKQESIAELLDAGGSAAKVVAAGCLAERYGSELAGALPEAQVLSFDDYGDIGARLDAVLAGERRPAHEPRDRRPLLPIAPLGRRDAAAGHVPGHGIPGPGPAPDLPPGVAPASGPRVLRRRLDGGPVAPLKIASGCDRRCSFCAIPAFRGAFLSRPPADVIAEAQWLASQGARELFLVSENSTSYGKDLGNLRLLDELLPGLAAVPGISRIRVSYLQPAELRPGLVDVMTSTPGVAPYFDLSFQHASGRVLRAMRRFGDGPRFCALLDQIRERCPEAGVRSNFIVGFPGETPEDVAALEQFLSDARLDAIGIFGYSDEDATEAASLDGHVDSGGDRAPGRRPVRPRRGTHGPARRGAVRRNHRRAHRGAAGTPPLPGPRRAPGTRGGRGDDRAVVGPLTVGDIVSAVVVGSEGVDLVAEARLSAPAGAPARAGMR